MNDTLEDAWSGCKMIDDTLRRKQLSVNYDKSKYLLIGSQKFRNDTMKTLKADPMNMVGVIIDHSEKEKYLGNWIHEKGCRASISETVKAGTTGLIGKAEEIIQVSELPMMNGNGNSMAALKLYEAQVIPALLFNSESWIGITDTHNLDLQNFQVR